MRTFAETFLYLFQQGANGEFVSQSKDLFDLMLNKIESQNIETLDEIGGHASVWALRAQMENCKVFAAPSPSSYNEQKL